MSPIPCAHCGNNFMRQTIDPEAPKLCNNCSLREEKRNPKKEGNMEIDIVSILIKCPKNLYTEIEEICINNGTNPSDYFLNLHHASQVLKGQEYKNTIRLKIDGTSPVKDAYIKIEEKEPTPKLKGNKK